MRFPICKLQKNTGKEKLPIGSCPRKALWISPAQKRYWVSLFKSKLGACYSLAGNWWGRRKTPSSRCWGIGKIVEKPTPLPSWKWMCHVFIRCACLGFCWNTEKMPLGPNLLTSSSVGHSHSISGPQIQVLVYPIFSLVPNSPWFRFTFVWIDIKSQDIESLRFQAVWCDKGQVVCLLVWPHLQLGLKLWVPLQEAQVSFCLIQNTLLVFKNKSLLANWYMQLYLEPTGQIMTFWFNLLTSKQQKRPDTKTLHLVKLCTAGALHQTATPLGPALSPSPKGTFCSINQTAQ